MSNLSNFETEEEVADRRKKRQEEWELVRRPDQPESKHREVDSFAQYYLNFKL